MTGLLMLLSVALAAAPECPDAPQDYLARLAEAAEREAYLCLAHADDAHPALLAVAIQPQADDAVANRYTRALALHLMLRLERAVSAEDARALNAADRRLLSDAVRARRGRRTPSAVHAKVFEQFDWYQPDDRYTNGRLDDVDRANIEMLDDPLPAPVTASDGATAADAVADAGPSVQVPRGLCGCASGALAGPWLLGLLAVLRRRG